MSKNSFKGVFYCAGARLKLGRRFRNHKMSIWQSLIPSLENIGRQSSLYYYPSEHSTLQLQGGAAVAGLVPPANVTAFRLPLSCPKVRSFMRRVKNVLVEIMNTIIKRWADLAGPFLHALLFKFSFRNLL